MSSPTPKLTPSGLSALMCARICHDLVSPIGALGTALEVLGDESNADMHADALELVKTSAGQASAKLQYLRLAFGAGGSAPGIIAMDELKRLVSNMYRREKSEIIWENAPDGLEKTQARLLLNLIMLAVQAIPRGGQLTLSIQQEEGLTVLNLCSEGLKARLDPVVVETLAGKAPEDGFDGRSIQPFYAGMIVRELKGHIQATSDDTQVIFTANLPV